MEKICKGCGCFKEHPQVYVISDDICNLIYDGEEFVTVAQLNENEA